MGVHSLWWVCALKTKPESGPGFDRPVFPSPPACLDCTPGPNEDLLLKLLDVVADYNMEVNGRHVPPSIPEDGEIPDEVLQGGMNGYHHRLEDMGEAEVPVSKSQRRKSDVKVYKEFCDFYAKL